MAVDERSRRRLYGRLEEALGMDDATVLMEHLPPVGWANVATKQDLAALEERIDLRFQQQQAEFTATLYQALNDAITSQTRTILFTLLGTVATVAVLAFSVVALALRFG